jgi:hypothetical protein
VGRKEDDMNEQQESLHSLADKAIDAAYRRGLRDGAKAQREQFARILTAAAEKWRAGEPDEVRATVAVTLENVAAGLREHDGTPPADSSEDAIEQRRRGA